MFFFFFSSRRRHTRLQGDWSSDVCSSDLALEPHTETLRLRGRILRDAGRYQAAEVAYEGVAQAAEHAEQRAAAEREIAATRRYAFYAPRRPDGLTPAERWFEIGRASCMERV